MSKRTPSLPTAKTQYTAMPTTEGAGKTTVKDLVSISKKQDAFIAKGSGKEEKPADNSSTRHGFVMSGLQRRALEKVIEKYPLKPGRKLAISIQDYLSMALNEMIKADAARFGIEVDLT